MNYWALIKDGKLLRHGTGAVRPRNGETLKYYVDEASMRAEMAVSFAYEKETAVKAIKDGENQKSEQTYTLKVAECQEFLRDVPEAANRRADQHIIDEEKYPFLYAEYWSTYDVDSRTPWELARDCVAKIADKPTIEGNRRRQKLLNKQVLDREEPTIDG